VNRLTRALRRLRYRQPLNRFATASVRAGLGALGLRSELLIRHLHRVGDVDSPLPNGRVLRLWSEADDWVSNQVFWRGWHGYEPETTPLFWRLASRARVTLDVGAYVGFFSLLAAHANPHGRIFAFEPLAPAFERLRSNVNRNGVTNVECLHKAVGAEAGSASFFHVRADAGIPCSSSLSYEFMRELPNLETSTVAVVSLDGFLDERGVTGVDLVKIDTESTEPQVLQGMQRTIRRDRPAIICEVLPGRGAEAALQEQIRDLEYRAYLLTPEGPVSKETVEGHPEWLNYLLSPLRPEEVARL
jgi:FkbM family methyltransferase